eukprot:SM000083S22713  [mRNA]  locus=s83:37140:38650:+ [translate_table: standard]
MAAGQCRSASPRCLLQSVDRHHLLLCAAVVHEGSKPTHHSHFEHSSIPATIKKIFNLNSDFLTARDAWASTFEGALNRKTPRTDCPKKMPSPPKSLRHEPVNEERLLTEWQQELVMLAAALVGDSAASNFLEAPKRMTVRQGNDYVENATRHFLDASLAALKQPMETMVRASIRGTKV